MLCNISSFIEEILHSIGFLEPGAKIGREFIYGFRKYIKPIFKRDLHYKEELIPEEYMRAYGLVRAGRPVLVSRLQTAKRELQQLFTQVRRIREQTEQKMLAIPI